MRKFRITPLVTLIICTLSFTLVLFIYTSKDSNKDCLVKADCSKNIEQIRSTELIWESLSRQFISTVSAY